MPRTIIGFTWDFPHFLCFMLNYSCLVAAARSSAACTWDHRYQFMKIRSGKDYQLLLWSTSISSNYNGCVEVLGGSYNFSLDSYSATFSPIINFSLLRSFKKYRFRSLLKIIASSFILKTLSSLQTLPYAGIFMGRSQVALTIWFKS